MSLNADLREFIELLNSRGVEYVIVGAHSLAFHGRPRYTGDLDLLVRPSRENAAKLVSLLLEGLEEKTPVSAGETPAITTQIRQISEWQAALTINY